VLNVVPGSAENGTLRYSLHEIGKQLQNASLQQVPALVHTDASELSENDEELIAILSLCGLQHRQELFNEPDDVRWRWIQRRSMFQLQTNSF
jgi:hypothetical protein